MSVGSDHFGSDWPPGVVLRPSAGPSSRVEVGDVFTGQRMLWKPKALAREILALTEGEDSAVQISKLKDLQRREDDREALVPGWHHWYERGWHPSDELYVASRRLWPFVDADDHDGVIRTAALERFLAEDGPPPPPKRPGGPSVSLPTAAAPGDRRISELLVHRRSERMYSGAWATKAQLSGLLWYGLQGVRERRQREDVDHPLSLLDSFGAGWDFYLCIYGVDDVEPGVYYYDICDHALVGIRLGDPRDAMCRVLQGLETPRTACWTIGLVADFPRYAWRYRHAYGLRKLYLEAGFIAQELLVLGMAYGLGSLVTPAQSDSLYLDLHGLDRDRFAPIHTLTMGVSRRPWAPGPGPGDHPWSPSF